MKTINFNYEPSTLDVITANFLGQMLSRYKEKDSLTLCMLGTDSEDKIKISPAAATLFKEILTAMAEGHDVKIVPKNAELTTEEGHKLLKGLNLL